MLSMIHEDGHTHLKYMSLIRPMSCSVLLCYVMSSIGGQMAGSIGPKVCTHTDNDFISLKIQRPLPGYKRNKQEIKQ
jgi:hypothetical protein